MPDQKNTPLKSADSHDNLDSVAERYLDLWHNNVKRWATDPDAMEKWLAQAKEQMKL